MLGDDLAAAGAEPVPDPAVVWLAGAAGFSTLARGCAESIGTSLDDRG